MSNSLSLHETLIPYSVSNREQTPLASTNGKIPRPQVRGKFFFIGRNKFFVRGVTYGTFRPRADGIEYPEPDIIEKDFTAISANGFNTIRTYTPPPRSILDAARAHGLYVLLGLPLNLFRAVTKIISAKKYARIGGEPFFMSESVIRNYSLKIQLPKLFYPSHFNRFAFSIDEIWHGTSLLFTAKAIDIDNLSRNSGGSRLAVREATGLSYHALVVSGR